MRMGSIRPDPLDARVVRAMRDSLAASAVDGAPGIEMLRSRPWNSATFAGRQCVVALTCPGGAARTAWLDALPDREWRIPGHIVADLTIDETTPHGATLTLLVLTDG